MQKQLLINTLIYWIDRNITERILWIDNQRDSVFLIDIYSNTYSPTLKEISYINFSIGCKLAEIIEEDPYFKIINEEDIKTNNKEKRDKAWKIISYIFDNCGEPDIYNSELRSKFIKSASSEYCISEKTIREYLKKYWQRGKTKNALLPDYHRSGGKGNEKKDSNRKRGRPSMLKVDGVNVDKKMKDTFRIALNKFYYTTKENSLKTAYVLMLKEYFSDNFRFDEGVKKQILMDKNKIPSFEQFRYWYQKERNIKKEISLRKSTKRYFLENRAVIGNSTQEAMGSGALYLIDATVMNIYIVSTFSNDIIGRPILYNVIDVYSRMIVGFYLGFEQNSWVGAMMALSNSTMNKVEFCAKYGITITESEWPVSNCIPQAILGDRGEMIGKNVENLIAGLGIRISNTPSYRAELKSIIEKYFDIIQTTIKPYVPGYVGGDYKMRGGKDYRLEAVLTKPQLIKILIKCVLFFNNHNWMDNYKREKMMIEDDIEPIPTVIWNWGIINKFGKLNKVNHDIIKLNLMPREKGAVTGRGIKFKEMFYCADIALKERWFEQARNNGSWKIDISYDPQNMDYIYMIGDDRISYEKCFLLEHEDRYKNKTLEEIEFLLQYEKIRSKENEGKKLQAKIDLISDIEAIVKESKEQIKEIENIEESNTKRTKNIRANQAKEKLINRQKDYIQLGKDNTVANSDFHIDKEELYSADDNFELIKKVQKERLANESN